MVFITPKPEGTKSMMDEARLVPSILSAHDVLYPRALLL